jgi:hypothetical protein
MRPEGALGIPGPAREQIIETMKTTPKATGQVDLC